MHWNAAKYAFVPSKKGIGAAYTPWMRQLVDDRNLFYVSGYTKLGEWETIAASIKYYSMGEFLLNDQTGSAELPYTPNEWSIDAAYIRKLFDFLSASITFRSIYTGLKAADYFEGNDNSTFGIAAGAAFYYHAPFTMAASFQSN